MSTKGEHINALPHGTGAVSAFKTYTAESRATGRTHTLISKAAVHAAVQRSRALGDVTPMTEEDLWKRVVQDASAKPYKALALDLADKARRRHDQAVEAALSVHHRIEKAQARLGAPSQMKAVFEAGRVREAFVRQNGALETLVETALKRTREAADFIAAHARSAAATIRSRSEGPASAKQPSPGPVSATPRSPGL